jgi:hypothetical protein
MIRDAKVIHQLGAMGVPWETAEKLMADAYNHETQPIPGSSMELVYVPSFTGFDGFYQIVQKPKTQEEKDSEQFEQWWKEHTADWFTEPRMSQKISAENGWREALKRERAKSR